MNPKVNFYFSNAGKWQEETVQLRKIVLDCGLNEELKWGVPCYTFQNSNIVLIQLHFSAPKQAKTRESRVEKCISKILNGKGLID